MDIELLKIIFEYSFNYKLADATFIKRVLNILIDNYNVSEFINLSIDFDYDCSCYNYVNKTLSFERDLSLKIYQKKSTIDEELNRIFLTNFDVLATIFHEFNHVLQAKNDALIPDNLEGILWAYCIDTLKNKNSFYKKYHNYFPIERMANINTYNHVYELIKMDPTFDKNIEETFNNISFHYRYFGYEIKEGNKLLSPLESFFNLIGDPKYFDTIKEYCTTHFKKLELTMEQKEYYGLPFRDADFIISKVEGRRHKILAKKNNNIF